jgi:hypothetical protein
LDDAEKIMKEAGYTWRIWMLEGKDLTKGPFGGPFVFKRISLNVHHGVVKTAFAH